jgi:hypothetical protein
MQERLGRGANGWHHRAMTSTYGSESPRAHAQTTHRAPSRYLVVIESEGTVIARLFSAARVQVAEFDAGVEEVVQMTSRLVPQPGAEGAEWDAALAGHSARERAAARVYTLDL